MSTIRVGYIGENLSRKHLEKKGFKFIEQNKRNRFGEIDLIMQDGSTLVFIEVRTKIGEWFGTPEETINKAKMGRLINNANSYVGKRDYKGLYRIDAVAVVLHDDETPKRITHYPNITG